MLALNAVQLNLCSDLLSWKMFLSINQRSLSVPLLIRTTLFGVVCLPFLRPKSREQNRITYIGSTG